MSDVSQIIWETCKTYLFQQGKFLAALWVLIAVCMVYYFGVLSKESPAHVVLILASSVLGILGSYGVAWFGIRINTQANSRAAFASAAHAPHSGKSRLAPASARATRWRSLVARCAIAANVAAASARGTDPEVSLANASRTSTGIRVSVDDAPGSAAIGCLSNDQIG